MLDLEPADLNIWDNVPFNDIIQLNAVPGIKSYNVTRNSDGQLVIDLEYNENIQEENLEVVFDGSAYPNLARAIPSFTNF